MKSHDLAPEEILSDLSEQLALDDGQLAIAGIARGIAASEKEMADAARSITFNRNYVPRHPGPRPHPEGGGMDHEDWRVAAYEYENADDETDEAIEYAENKRQNAEDKLYDLQEDKELVEGGDEEVASKYAAHERERIQAEIEKIQQRQEGAKRHEAWLNGAEIDGAHSLSTTIVDLATDPDLGDVRGKVSASGWKFAGTTPEGNRLMFEKLPVEAIGEPERSHYKFNDKRTELLTIGFSKDDGTSIEYANATDVDEDAVKRYGKNIANVETYKFKIKESGKVSEQRHYKGSINGHLPYFMNNGTVARAESVHGITPEPQAELSETDIQRMQAKITEVANAMKELAEQA